jgi:pimeloyl-ACP methyl ester carboxylesterase
MTSTETSIRRTITERYLEGQRGPMRFWESSPAGGPPLLLIHGYGAMIEHWRPVMRPIAAQHTLYALDLYFFGRSAIPQEPPSRRLWAEQAAELITTVCTEPVVVVGHSMGGVAACQLAHDFPQLVRGLALVSSSGMIDPSRPPSAWDSAFFDLVSAPGLGELVAGLAANPIAARQGLLNAYHRKERVTPELVARFAEPLARPGGSAAYLAVTRAFRRLLLDLEKGSITAPALLIWGEHDRSLPPSLAQLFKERLLPQAEIAILKDAGHCPFDETPEAFLDALLPWAARLPR